MDTNNQIPQTNTDNDEKLLNNSGVEIMGQENTNNPINPISKIITETPIKDIKSTIVEIPQKNEDISIQQLEEQFQTELGKPVQTEKQDVNYDLGEKVKELGDTKNDIDIKIKGLNEKVKKELEDLKKMKEGIGEEIKKIKELEDKENQINQKIEDIKKLEEERTKIEQEVDTLKEGIKKM